MANFLKSYISRVFIESQTANDDVVTIETNFLSPEGDVFTLERRVLQPNLLETQQTLNELKPEVSTVYPYKIVPPRTEDGTLLLYSPSVDTEVTASQNYYTSIYFERYQPNVLRAINKSFTELVDINALEEEPTTLGPQVQYVNVQQTPVVVTVTVANVTDSSDGESTTGTLPPTPTPTLTPVVDREQSQTSSRPVRTKQEQLNERNRINIYPNKNGLRPETVIEEARSPYSWASRYGYSVRTNVNVAIAEVVTEGPCGDDPDGFLQPTGNTGQFPTLPCLRYYLDTTSSPIFNNTSPSFNPNRYVPPPPRQIELLKNPPSLGGPDSPEWTNFSQPYISEFSVSVGLERLNPNYKFLYWKFFTKIERNDLPTTILNSRYTVEQEGVFVHVQFWRDAHEPEAWFKLPNNFLYGGEPARGGTTARNSDGSIQYIGNSGIAKTNWSPNPTLYFIPEVFVLGVFEKIS